MKKLWIILLLWAASAMIVVGQDTSAFSQWKQKRNSDYHRYKDSLAEDYESFLNQRWLEFELYSRQCYIDKKSNYQPIVDTIEQSPEQLKLGFVCDTIFPARMSDTIDSMLHTEYVAEVMRLMFYCREVVFRIPIEISKIQLEGVKERQVSRMWKQLEQASISKLLPQLQRYRQDLYLNDWGVYDLMHQLSAKVYPKNEDAQVIMNAMLLNMMHYDVRIGKHDGHLVLLANSSQVMYDKPYIVIGNKKYYTIKEYLSDARHHRISTYLEQYPEAVNPIDLNLYYSPRIGGCLATKPYTYSNGSAEMKVWPNQALIDFYSHYPQTELSVYANAAVEEAMGLSMENALRPLLAGKNKQECVGTLLQYVQVGFKYKLDNIQFGREKTMFCEENFYYGANDCEDRAVLFAYLVNRLTNLQVVLLEYEGHVASAVCFDDEQVKGCYYKKDNLKYVVCDPTTSGAKVGQLNRKYRRQTPNMIIIKSSN